MGSLEKQVLDNARKNLIPLTGTFELTPRCTLDCKMCYIHLTNDQMGDRHELTTQEWIRIIDEAVDAGTVFVQLTGGECLLHPGFRDIYLHLKKKSVLIIVNSNATLLNDEYIDFFRVNPPNRLQISLYGFSNEMYKKVTGQPVFDSVISAVLKAKEAGINVKISITVSKYLYDDTLKILKFALDHHFDYIIDMDMGAAYSDTGRSDQDFSVSPEEAASKYVEIYNLLGMPLNDNPIVTVLPELDTSENEYHGFLCSAGRARYVIKWDGTFVPCFMEGIGYPNVLDTGFKKGWELITKMAATYNYPVECLSCKYNKLCTSCPLRREDPLNPGHRNINACRMTITKYNAGIGKLSK